MARLSFSFYIGAAVVFGCFLLMSFAWRYKAVKVVSIFNLFVFFCAAFLLSLIAFTGSLLGFIFGLAILAAALYFCREGLLRLQFMKDGQLLYRDWWRAPLRLDDAPEWAFSFAMMAWFISLCAMWNFAMQLCGIMPSTNSFAQSLFYQLLAAFTMVITYIALRNNEIKKLLRLA